MVAELVQLKKQQNPSPVSSQRHPLFLLDGFIEELDSFAKFQQMNASNQTINKGLEELRKLWCNYLEKKVTGYYLLRANGKSRRKAWQKILKDFSTKIEAFLSEYSLKERRLISSFFIYDELRKVAEFFSLIPDERTMGRILVEQREIFLSYWVEYCLLKEYLMFRHSMSQFLADTVEFLLFN